MHHAAIGVNHLRAFQRQTFRLRPDLDDGAHRGAVVKIKDVLIEQADTAGAARGAQAARLSAA